MIRAGSWRRRWESRQGHFLVIASKAKQSRIFSTAAVWIASLRSQWRSGGPHRAHLSCPGQAATRKRCGAEPGPKWRHGTTPKRWVPALQRIAADALRCVRPRECNSSSYSNLNRTRGSPFSRHIVPELCFSCRPRKCRGRREGRVPAGHPRSTVRKLRYEKLHSGIQVKPNIRPSLRSGFTAYVVLSPGSDALLPPSPCGWLMRAPGRARRITASLGAQTPGRQDHTILPYAPVVCAPRLLTE